MNVMASATRAQAATTVGQRQEVFRRCLNVLSQPGTVEHLCEVVEPAEGDDHAFAWASLPILVLADLMTPVAAFHEDHEACLEVERLCVWTHAVRRDADEARFVLSLGVPLPSSLERVNRGTAAEPERGATLCQRVQTFFGGVELLLRGPGIADSAHIRVAGLDPAFFHARTLANEDYPRGFDILLVSDTGQIVGIPRTTRVEVLA